MKRAEMGRQYQIALEHLRRVEVGREPWDLEDEDVEYFAHEVSVLSDQMAFHDATVGQFA
jgi:hypothetical protein